jgi:hypothetical protein
VLEGRKLVKQRPGLGSGGAHRLDALVETEELWRELVGG